MNQQIIHDERHEHGEERTSGGHYAVYESQVLFEIMTEYRQRRRVRQRRANTVQ